MFQTAFQNGLSHSLRNFPVDFFESRLFFFAQFDKEAAERLNTIQREENESQGEVLTFGSKFIDEFLKKESIANKKDFQAHFQANRLYAYLKYKQDTYRRLEPVEGNLLSYYDRFKNFYGGALPDIQKEHAEAEKELKTAPTDATKLLVRNELQERLIEEQMGKSNILGWLNKKEDQKKHDHEALGAEGQDIEKTVIQKYKEVRKEWKKMSGGEKLFLVVGAIFTINMLNNSTNQTVKDIKNTLWGAAKLTVVGAFVNKLVQLGTGKSGIKWLKQWDEQAEKSTGFVADHFKNDENETSNEEAEIFQKGIAFLDTYKVGEMFDSYSITQDRVEAERKEGETLVQLGKRRPDIFIDMKKHGEMKPFEAYIAADVFFRKYPYSLMESKYHDKPNVTFTDMVSRETYDDPAFRHIAGGGLGALTGGLMGTFGDGAAAVRDGLSGAASTAGESITSAAQWSSDLLSALSTKLGLLGLYQDAKGTIVGTYNDYKIHIDATKDGIINGIKLVGWGFIIVPYTVLRGVDLFKKKGVDRVRNWLLANFAQDHDVLNDHVSATTVSSYISSGKLGNFQNHFNGALLAKPTLETSSLPDQASFEESGKAYYFIYKIDALPQSAPTVDDALRRSMFSAYSVALNDLGPKIQNGTFSTDLDLVEMVGGCTDNTHKYYLFLRAPKNDSVNREYALRRANQWKGGSAMEMKKKDLFEAGELHSPILHPDDFLEIQVNNGLKKPADVSSFLAYFDREYGGLGYEQAEVYKMVKGYENSISTLNNAERNRIFTAVGIVSSSSNVVSMTDVEAFQKKRDKLREFVTDKYKEKGYTDQTARSEVLLNGLKISHYTKVRNFWNTPSITENALNQDLIDSTMNALVDNLEMMGKISLAEKSPLLSRYKAEFLF